MTTENITNGVATGAVASPVWLPWLMETSQVAGLLLPIFGVIWLLVQITIKQPMANLPIVNEGDPGLIVWELD